MKWKKGRQGSGYDVLTIVERGFSFLGLLGFDLHAIRYNKGDSIPEHVDAVKEGKHHRLNIVIKQPKEGGVFKCEKFTSFYGIIYFRPDLHRHSVSECGSERLVLSLGWVLK